MNSDLRRIEIEGFQVFRDREPLLVEMLSADFGPAVLNLITGENGSGKTTLLDLLAHRTRQSRGCKVRPSGNSLAREIAYMPQRSSYLSDVRVRHLIDLASSHGRLIGKEPEAIQKKMEKLPRCEVGELSGGEQQILLFWLVSSQPVHVFIYDEPLRHLDNNAASQVIDVIEQQVRRGDLVIVSDHSDGSNWSVPTRRISLVPRASSR